MNIRLLGRFVRQWGMIIGILAGTVGLLAGIANLLLLFYPLTLLGWFMVALWLWSVANETRNSNDHPSVDNDYVAERRAALEIARRALAILEQQASGYTSLTIPVSLQIELDDKRKEVTLLENDLKPAGRFSSYSASEQSNQPQKRVALVTLVALSILFSAVLSWKTWLVVHSSPDVKKPALITFPEEKLGIIIAEFTQGAEERATFVGGEDIRDAIYNDLSRLTIQLKAYGIGERVSIQEAGPVRNQEEAIALGKKYQADLIVWGYVPVNHPNSFRPNFTVLTHNDDLIKIEPDLFGVELTGTDIIEVSSLLTKRVRAVSSYVLGTVYLNDGQKSDYALAAVLFTQAIDETHTELAENEGSQDTLYNLAILYLMRGGSYAAMDMEDKALADYQKSLEYRPDLPRSYAAIGNVYYARRDFETAWVYYENAKTTWRGNYGLGLISYQRGEYSLSLEYLLHSLDMIREQDYPNTRSEMVILFSVGMTYKQLGDWQSAQPLLTDVCFADDLPQNFLEGACLELTPYPTNTKTSTSPTLLPTGLPTSTRTATPMLFSVTPSPRSTSPNPFISTQTPTLIRSTATKETNPTLLPTQLPTLMPTQPYP